MKSKRTITKQDTTLVEIGDDEDNLPEVTIESSFKTLNEWLFAICDSDKPTKAIAKYSLGLIEAEHERILFLVGINTDSRRMFIDFRPTNMYFLIPNDRYKNLNKEQLISQLTTDLIEFTNTDKFKSSFLAESKSVTFNDSIVIWSKP
ncbi:MAG: hypothetical protein BGO55_21480 [Sphingobacteriales bacterium 50-39]|nr:hypothetical protein [Sphingobacteriales bacterium]OJW59563.1 MAG: hypothetical protein BGO55_21480 [Sphingobacteriales bacterium 50-39]